MKKKIKRIISSVLCFIMIVSVVLPIMPAIEVKADDEGYGESITFTNGLEETRDINGVEFLKEWSYLTSEDEVDLPPVPESDSNYYSHDPELSNYANIMRGHFTTDKNNNLDYEDIIEKLQENINSINNTIGVYLYRVVDGQGNNFYSSFDCAVYCIFDTENNEYYYCVYAYGDSARDKYDFYGSLVFKSKHLILPCVTNFAGTSTHEDALQEAKFAAQNTQLSKETIQALIDGYVDTDKMVNDFNAGDVTDESTYKAIDEFLSYSFNTDDTFEVWVKPARVMEIEFCSGDDDLKITVSTIKKFKEHYKDPSDSTKIYRMYEPETVNIAERNWLDFGDLNSGNTNEEVGVLDKSIKKITSCITTGDTGDMSDFDNDLNNWIGKLPETNEDGESALWRTIFSKFEDEWGDAARGWDIRDKYKDEVDFFKNIPENPDDFTIMSYILAYNLYCIANDNKSYTGTKVTYKDANDNDTTIYLDDDNLNITDGGANTRTVGQIWQSIKDSEPYQHDMLVEYYKGRIKYLRDEGHNVGDYLMDVYNSLLKLLYSSDDISKFNKKHGNFDEKVQEVLNNVDDDLVDTNSIYNVARNCNALGHYIIGSIIYGEGEENSNNVSNIYQSTMHSLAIGDNYNFEGVNEGYGVITFPKELGSLKNCYGILASTEDSFDSFNSFMYNVSYAFDVAAFSDGAQGNYDPATLYEFMAGTKDSITAKTGAAIGDSAKQVETVFKGGLESLSDSASSMNFNNDEFSINMIRSVIELHDLCEFLGILDAKTENGNKCCGCWTESIKWYTSIYADFEEVFESFRHNPYIYKKAQAGERTVEEPLGMFFSIKGSSMSDEWMKGFALSSLYVPLETNLYDATSISYIEDSDYISDFYYKYAFYRKALYINTDNSAIVNETVSGEKSGTRVATLSDLLNYERDIILYVDDNFYNARDTEQICDRLDYTAIRNNVEDIDEKGTSIVDKFGNAASSLLDLAPNQILKTGSESYYSQTLVSHVTPLGQEPSWIDSITDAYLLSESDILGDDKTESAFASYEYSVKVPYAVVSSVYRSPSLYNECLLGISSDNAIFKSSKGICEAPGTTREDWLSIYNYAMLMNLEDQLKNDAASTLDLDAPIFCDIFGNIICESGLVIIPAAANATLSGEDWTPYTVGFSEYYNNGNHLVTGEFSDEVYTWLTGSEYDSNGTVETNGESYVGLTTGYYSPDKNSEETKHGGGYFTVDRSGDLILKTKYFSTGSAEAIIQWNALNKNSTIIKKLFFDSAYKNTGQSGKIYSPKIVNLVVETMRGAPIENIDYTYEGLSGKTDISKFGVWTAYKMEELSDMLISGTNGNALGGNPAITMPNLAFVSGIEYIVLFVFKIMFAVLVVILAVSLYLDAVKSNLGIKSVGKFLVTCILTIVAMTIVPNLISWSYYEANKSLLTEEAGYIVMLNYVKEYDGAEIGITDVRTPETQSKFYIKVDDISVNWWDVIGTVLFGDTDQTVSDLYENQLKDNAMAMQPSVQMKGDGLYVDVQDVFDSTNITYYPVSNTIQNVAYSNSGSKTNASAVDDTVVSFNMPYYVFLDKLTAAVNEYNQAMDVSAYSYTIGANGHIMTYDLISPYLTSNEFLDEGFDILALNDILQTGVNLTSYTSSIFSGDASTDRTVTLDEETGQWVSTYSDDSTPSDIAKMQQSKWYPSGDTQNELTQERINELYEFARNYVARNKAVLGKIPDEVFLKVFALELAIKYNKIWGISCANSIEIMNVDTRDLVRMLIADRSQVYKYYSYGFARFVYEETGTIGVIFTALYLVILWLTSIIKPLFMIVILLLLIINILGRKLLFRKESRCIEGYLIGCACLVLSNYAYSLMLKLTLNISQLGFGSILALVIAFLVQVIYVGALIFICYVEVKDWRDNGFNKFAMIGSNFTAKVAHTQQIVADKVVSRQNQSYAESANSRRYAEDNYDASSIDDMMERDREREDNAMNVI